MSTKFEVTLDGWKLSLNLYDLIGSMTGEDRAKVIDALACSDEVINEVANQIIDGWTTEGSHAASGCGGNPDATYGLDGARMRIAKASSEIAAKEIAALAEQINREKALAQKGWDAYHELIQSQRSYG